VIRNVVFWMHLTAGLFAGVVVFVMSFTGVLLTYEKQMLAWNDRRAAEIALPAPGTPRASLETIVEKVAAATPGSGVATMTRRADPQAPVSVTLASGGVVLAHPNSGEIIGDAPTGMRRFFRGATDWHRYLAGQGAWRATGRAITGACNLAFLFLVLSGLYLWLPRRWTAAALRAAGVPRWRHATSKARDFNWHNALGVWSAVPLAIVVASATVISYPWASDLAYRVVGEAPPPRPAAPPGTGAGAPAARRPGSAAAPERGETRAPQAPAIAGLDARWQSAEAQVPDWQSIAMRLPSQAGAPLVFTIDAGFGGQPQYRGTLTLDAQTGSLVRWETFADQSLGRRFRSTLRFAHTGEFWGIPGQTIAGIVSAAACILVWTGLALAWRRYRAWRARRREAPSMKVAA
jgi:uncharacterized iron-regulated membrane protein